jgi:hypothetical protein
MDDPSSSIHRPLSPSTIAFDSPSVLRKRNSLHGELLPGRQPDIAVFDTVSVCSSPSMQSEEVSKKEGNIPLDVGLFCYCNNFYFG